MKLLLKDYCAVCYCTLIGCVLLSGCSQSDTELANDRCLVLDASFGEPHTFCGFESPTEFAVLPGKSLVVGELGKPNSGAGQLTLLHLQTGDTQLLYDADSSNDLRVNNAIWGDLYCEEPDYFQPHAMSLAQRPSGRWQLLAVNRGLHDSVEMFELMPVSETGVDWQLVWRGCVNSIADGHLTDVLTTDSGFVVTESLAVAGIFDTISRFFGKTIAHRRWQWSLQYGMRPIAQSKQAKTVSNTLIVESYP